MTPRIDEVWMQPGGTWYATVRLGSRREHLKLDELTALAVDALAKKAKREAEPDLGPNLPCCGYPRAECECGAEVAT